MLVSCNVGLMWLLPLSKTKKKTYRSFPWCRWGEIGRFVRCLLPTFPGSTDLIWKAVMGSSAQSFDLSWLLSLKYVCSGYLVVFTGPPHPRSTRVPCQCAWPRESSVHQLAKTGHKLSTTDTVLDLRLRWPATFFPHIEIIRLSIFLYPI